MTTLPAAAGSFSGHVCGNPLRSVLKAPSEPQDVLSGVNVPVGRVSTSTAVRPFRKRFLDIRKRTAPATYLRGVLRVNRDDSHPSLLRFGCEDIEKLSPARIMGALSKMGSSDTLHVQGFVSDHAEPLREPSGFLMMKVPALVGRLLVQTGNSFTGLASAVRTFLLARKSPLSLSEPLLCHPVVAGRLYHHTIGGNKKRLKPEVYTDGRTLSTDFGCITEVAGENDVPLAARPLDTNGLDATLDGAMQLDLDVPNMLEVKPSVLVEPASVSVGGELNKPETISSLEARIAWSFFASINSSEERLERFIQPPERGLSARKVDLRQIRIALASRFENAGLFPVGDRTLLRLIDVPAFFKSGVVQAAVCLKHRIKSPNLGAVGKETIFERSPHRLSVRQTDASLNNSWKGGERGFHHRPMTMVHAA